MCTLKINKHKWDRNDKTKVSWWIWEEPLVLSLLYMHMLNAFTCWNNRQREAAHFKVSYNNTVNHLKAKLHISTTSTLFKILQIFHFQGLCRYESINNLDTKIWSFRLKRQIALCLPGLKQWILMHLVGERDKSVLLILCHIYQLITYLLFQFFPSLQPSCLRTLHLWQGDKKVSIQGW